MRGKQAAQPEMLSSHVPFPLDSTSLRRSNSRSLLIAVDPAPMKVGGPPPISGTILQRSWKRLQGPLIILWMLSCCKVAVDSVTSINVETRNNLLYETFLYYNPLFLVALMLWLWGINIWAFTVSRINYAKVFELDATHSMWKEIWVMASWITFIVLTSMTSYLYLSSHGNSLAASQPVLLYSILPLIMVLPVDVFYVSYRIFFLRTLVRIFLPLQPITFVDFLVADIFTSMAKVLSDIERATCRMFHGQVATLSWFEPDSTCGSHSIWIPRVLALPYLCRFFQCLRKYSDTKDRTCILNALKYATSFHVILLSALKYRVAAEIWEGLYRPLWLLFGLINTCFSFYWDIRHDWDLRFANLLSHDQLQNQWLYLIKIIYIAGVVYSFFSGISSGQPLLRANLFYSYHWVYYGAIGSNLLLRWAWTYKLSAHLRHNYITVFLMTALEILRRFQWILFRVESEWNKLSRSNSQTVSKDTSEAERLLSSIEHNV